MGVAGSSTRGLPSASIDDSPLAAEFAESIAVEPSRRWKSPESGASHSGSNWIPCVSCPVAAANVASKPYVDDPQAIVFVPEWRKMTS